MSSEYRNARLYSLNVRQSVTTIGRHDPLKKFFRGIFEMLPPGTRGHVVGFLGEFIGTMLFIFLAFAGVESAGASSHKPEDQTGSVVNTAPPSASPALLLYIALSAGFALVVTAWTFFRISGGLFNPVISLGMFLIGAITWGRCLLLIGAQFAGTIVASYMVYALFWGGLNTGTVLGGNTSPAKGVIIEMLLTAQLAFVIFMLAAEEHDATYLAPIGIGLSVFIAHLVGAFWTGASMNPARSLAPCIVNRSFPSYHWIYWVGPIAGVILAVIVYKLVKALEYETAQEVAPQDLLPRVVTQPASRKPSSIIPMPSHSVAASIRRVSTSKVESSKPRQLTAANKDEGKQPEKKKPVVVLPECYAD